MNTFYADDTYAKSDPTDKAPMLHLFGGVLISKESEKKLVEIIGSEKAKYTHPNLPVKWNFKDSAIKEKYEQFDRLDQFETMLINSKDWRRSIIKESLGLDYQIICGVTESYSRERKTIKNSKEDILKYTFENILMRIGYDAKDSPQETFVILDWPPDGKPKPFIDAYYKLYHTGVSSANRIENQ